MPWKEKTVPMSRAEFVRRASQGEKSFSALCREYGISRPTGYKWLKRAQNQQGLTDRSRAPHRRPHQTPPEIEQLVLAYRTEHPAIGALKTKRILENAGHTHLPCARTIHAIFKRHGCIRPEASRAARPYQRFEKATPNELWQADFKGHFRMLDGQRCHPLNILDDCSRFNLCADALVGETFEAVQPSLLRIFAAYGLPLSLLCDHGNPWGTAQSTGFTRFEVWLMELGILPLHGRVHHPQTQGKGESFNRAMQRELLRYTQIANLVHAQQVFDAYRQFYNHERPHHALQLAVPASRYQPSRVRLPEKIAEWDYPAGYELRRVKEIGYVTIRGQGYFLSEAFGGKMIAVRDSQLPGAISLFFRQFRIGRIDVDRRVFTLKKAYLIEGDPRLQPRE